MNVIITSIGGLLGRELAIQARRLGHRVIGLARRFDSAYAGLADEWVIEDLACGTGQDWRSVAGEAVVYHLAADTRIYGDGEGFYRDNVRATATACDIARQTGGRLVFFSSGAVYSGEGTSYPLTPLTEHSVTNPVIAYGRSKKAAEELIAGSGISAVVLRIFGVLSERLVMQSARGNLVQAIEHSLRTGEELVLGIDSVGRVAVRDYVLAEDVCGVALRAGALLAHETSALGATQFVNLCTGVPTSTWEMAQIAQVATGKMFPIRFESRGSTESEVMVGDGAALQRLLGVAPRSRVREFWERAAVNRCCAAWANPIGVR